MNISSSNFRFNIAELLIIKSIEKVEEIINQYIPNAVYEHGRYFSQG